MTMKMLHATLLSLFIASIASVSAQNSQIAYISSGAAPQGSKCLNVGDLSDGAPVQIYDCNKSPTEQWEIGYPGSGTTEVKVAGSDFCLDAGIVDSSNSVVISHCTQNPSQQWNYTETSYLRLIYSSDLCLDVPNSSVDNDVQVQTYPCNDGKNQEWRLQYIN